MKVTLDRRHCSRWQGSCESCFATRLEQNNFDAADCGLQVLDDGRKTIDFAITDRDGSHKTLSVTPENRAEAVELLAASLAAAIWSGQLTQGKSRLWFFHPTSGMFATLLSVPTYAARRQHEHLFGSQQMQTPGGL